jgi:hypothetical protein
MIKQQDKIKLKKYFVYMEPELWLLLRRLSLAKGCVSHPDAGSASEAARRFIKKSVIGSERQLINVKNINWQEMYT